MAVARLNFYSRALGITTNVTMILPSFDQNFEFGRTVDEIYNSGRKFPALWLLHGGSGDDADYLNWTNVARYAVEYDCAVICPAYYNSGLNDYNPGSKYSTYITEELWNFVHSYFPISDKREDNFIGGLSMGAGGALKYAVTLNDRFSYALIMSGGLGRKGSIGKGHVKFRDLLISIGWPMPKQPSNLPPRADIEALLRQKIADGEQLPTFVMACGDQDNIAWETHVSGVEIMRDELGLNVVNFEVPGLRHEWDFWEICMRKAFSEWLPCKQKIRTKIAEVWNDPVPGRE